MASTHGSRSLTVDLQESASSYAFYQALRFLRRQLGSDQALREFVRVHPNLSLAFPDTDIESIQLDDDGVFNIEANFFGLYGVSSPLPTFYTEDLIAEATQGNSAMRDFLDIIHAALYPLLYKAWEKNRLWLLVREQNNNRRLQQLFAFVGLADAPKWQSEAQAMLPFAGLFNAYPRSAAALQSLLQGVLQGATVKVESCIERWVEIPAESISRLGQSSSKLGVSTILGHKLRDSTGNFNIVLGPVDAQTYHQLVPGARLYRLLCRVVGWFLPVRLRAELQIWLAAPERQCASLGAGWHSLGYNMWLGAGVEQKLQLRPVSFPINTLETTHDTR